MAAEQRNPEFEQLFREIYRKLVAVALSLYRITPEDAEDAAEAALEEVLRKWPALDNPRAYAYRATISNVLKMKRKQAGLRRALLRKIYRGDYQPELHEDPGMTDVEYRQWVMSIIDFLPLAQREAVALCLVDELSSAEAGVLLGKSGDALRQALHAGRESLKRRILEEATIGPSAKGRFSDEQATIAGHKENR